MSENDKLREALDEFDGKLENWSNAYPQSVFREPSDEELEKAHAALQTVGLTLDVLSASAMRYVATSLAAHFLPVREALAASKSEPQETEEDSRNSWAAVDAPIVRPEPKQCHKRFNGYCNCERQAMLCDGFGPNSKPDPQAQAAEPEVVAYGTWDSQLGQTHRLMKARLDYGQDGCKEPLITLQAHREAMARLQLENADLKNAVQIYLTVVKERDELREAITQAQEARKS